MQAVVLAGGQGTRLRPLTDTKPKALVEVNDTPIIEYGLRELVALGADDITIVVGYKGDQIRNEYGEAFQEVPINYVEQTEQLGLAHALLEARPLIDGDFMLMLGDNIFDANLQDVVQRHTESRLDASMLVEEVPWEEASRYGVCDTNKYGEIERVVEKPDDPPSNLVMTGFYTFTPAIFDACRLVQPSDRGEYEISDAIDLLLHADRNIAAVPIDGWRMDIGYPEDRDEAEKRVE